MLLSNRFSFFNKSGDNINPLKRQATTVSIIDDAQFPGIGAIINAYTNIYGQVIYVEIIDGGSNYGPNTYIEIRSIDNAKILFKIPNNSITINNDGTIVSIDIPVSDDNYNLPYPAIDYFTDYSLERVSTGLIAVDQLYILENVYYDNGISIKDEYTFPRVENYGPFEISSYSANGTSARLTIVTYPFVGNLKDVNQSKIYRVPSTVINDLQIGMIVTGTGVPDGTLIYDIDAARQIVTLSNVVDNIGNVSFSAYFPHGLKVGSKISIDGGALAGDDYVLTQVSTYDVFFNSSLVISQTSGAGVTYNVTPKFRAYLNGDDSFFLFNVNYQVDYPIIEKSKSIEFEFTKATTDTIPTSGGTGGTGATGGTGSSNVLYQRTVYEDLQKTPFTLNIGHSADVEGNFLTVLRIVDETFEGTSELLFYGVYRAETEAEDERLGLLLENFGRDVDAQQELILRDSDVNEDNVNYILLNQKRKEMLLMGEQIWPYLGSYRGLVNMINWFGYYDIRLKEYFLNINSMDAEYGKYRQVPITFQLKNKKALGQELNLVPSKHYKKTSLFGLFYDIVKDSGEFDENGVPITQDAFEFTNEEALIKFFALKKYLKEKFLPLNAQIVDITGEGVYYETYALNNWNNNDQRRILELSRPISFSCEERVQIEDLRPYTGKAYFSPTLEETLVDYLNKYDIRDVLVTNPGGPYTSFPSVNFPGVSTQQARGFVLMKGHTGGNPYFLANPAGTNYVGGEIITLSGGVFDIPIRLEVATVSVGAVTSVNILSGPLQGSNYKSFPQSFGQSLVVAQDGSQYKVVNRSGFTAAPSDLGFEVEDVILLDLGLGYSTYPSVVFTPNIGNTTADPKLKIYPGAAVGEINNNKKTPRWNDAPAIPVGAIASLSTEFPLSWDEVPYAWREIGGSNDANIKVYVDPLPSGSGQVIAAEIIETGTGYTRVPTVQIISSSGYGATATASIRNSKLNILEYTVTGVASSGGTNNVFTVTPDIASAGNKSVSLNRLVKGKGITDLVLTSAVTSGAGSTITVIGATGGPATTTVQVGDKIRVHEGITIDNGGSGYTSVSGVNINSGHTQSIFTWSTLGRGEFYQMQWKVQLQEPEVPTRQFYYDSGIQNIDALVDHTVILPYTGKYTVEMIAYNTDNNYANLIKRNCIDVFIPEADFSYIAKFVNECIDTWDSTKQLPNTLLNKRADDLTNNRNIEYNWESANGRWVNILFNDTSWDNVDFRWDVLNVSDTSVVNNYNFPYCGTFPLLRVSAQDNEEGTVYQYRDSTTNPSAINPTIIVNGQRIYPEIEPAYHTAPEYIFIRRDDTVYQLNVLDADYSTIGYTYIELVDPPPSAFIANPKSWEVLREIGGTIVLPGNQIYDPVSNPSGIQVDKYLKIYQSNNTPILKRTPINGKDIYSGPPSYIKLDGLGSLDILKKQDEIGKIYKIRDDYPNNGDLVWDPTDILSKWWIKPLDTVDPNVRDYKGRIYMRADGSGVSCDPLNEIRPGFTIIKLYAYVNGLLEYTQDFRTTHIFLDTSDTGEAYDIWNVPSYVIDVVGLNGGSIDDLNSYLSSLYALPNQVSVYLEYEYNEFTTRTYYGSNSSGDALVYFDFNTYPASLQFSNAPASDFSPLAINSHTNWYFEQGIDDGDFSLRVTNVGLWQGGAGTIITVEDEDQDLMRISSSYSVCQRNFDEDSAERKLGTQVLNWKNYQDVIWEESCSLTWNTLDFPTSYWCNFIIDTVVQNSGLTFNEDDQYSFTGIVGGMTLPQIYQRALYELNNLTSKGLSQFNYFPSTENAGDISFISTTINTYRYPNTIISPSPSVVAGDVIWGEPFDPSTTVTSVIGNLVSLNANIQKKASFIGSAASGATKITNIEGLLENQVSAGDIITSSILPSYPAAPATVTSVKIVEGKIKELTLSSSLSGSGNYISFNAEWNQSIISATVLKGTGTSFKIVAQSKTPSVDALGYLTGSGGLTFETPDGSVLNISHTFPVGNFYSWLGFGPNKVGSFLHGINEFVIKYRNVQTYLSEGVSPIGYNGWYPATNLPTVYSYITSPYIINSKEAEAQSQRLPYERSIGGSFTWEETWMDKSNGKIPLGTSVMFTSDTSKIAGKTKYLWKIKEKDETLVETIDPEIMWNFTYPGIFSVELTVEDTNGNSNTLERKTFIEVYEAKKS